ncbi:MAG: B12-binding domain-containing protein [Gemmataceae bacterium]
MSTAQVAQALGVSVTTVKRWVDDQILPAHRTAGGHRKLLMADVVRAVRDGNLPQADLSRLLPRTTTAPIDDPLVLYRQLVDAFNSIDTDLIRGIIHGCYQSGMSVEVIADKIISPAMNHVGHEWEKGRLDVMQEHRITQACISAFYELRAFLRTNAEKGRPIAIGGAAEHDHYVLPSLLTKLTLLDCGWDAINLGPHTPAAAFKSAIEDLSPQLLWYSVAHIENEDKFLADYEDIYRCAELNQVAVAIGGRALSDRLRIKLPYTTFGDGLIHLASFARSLYRRPQRPRRGRPPGTTTSSGLEANATEKTAAEATIASPRSSESVHPQ